MFKTYEIQIDTPMGRSMFLLVAAPNAEEASLLARDLLLEFTAPDDRAFVRRTVGEATIYEVEVRRIQTAA